MSVKFFGEFLVNKGVLPAQSLVGALIEQISTQPPVCKIAFENKVFSPEQFLSIFRHQQDRDSDFISSCSELGLWSDEIDRKIKIELTKLRTPLGEILLRRNDIDLKTLTHMLDEFLAQVEARKIPSESTEVDLVSNPDASFIEASSQVTNEVEEMLKSIESEIAAEEEFQEDEFTHFQEGILMELEDIFDERKRKVIKVALSLIKDKSVTEDKAATKLFHDSLKISHTINGLLKLFGVQSLGKLITFSEKLLECHLRRQSSQDEHQRMAELLYRAYEEAWKLRVSLISTGSEKEYMKDHSSRSIYQGLINELTTAIAEAS